MKVGENLITSEGLDQIHTQIYTNSKPQTGEREEVVLFNGGVMAIPFTHVKECQGWYRNNTCTCPKDNEEDDY